MLLSPPSPATLGVIPCFGPQFPPLLKGENDFCPVEDPVKIFKRVESRVLYELWQGLHGEPRAGHMTLGQGWR